MQHNVCSPTFVIRRVRRGMQRAPSGTDAGASRDLPVSDGIEKRKNDLYGKFSAGGRLKVARFPRAGWLCCFVLALLNFMARRGE